VVIAALLSGLAQSLGCKKRQSTLRVRTATTTPCGAIGARTTVEGIAFIAARALMQINRCRHTPRMAQSNCRIVWLALAHALPICRRKINDDSAPETTFGMREFWSLITARYLPSTFFRNDRLLLAVGLSEAAGPETTHSRPIVTDVTRLIFTTSYVRWRCRPRF
jgi:hypothetical protein